MTGAAPRVLPIHLSLLLLFSNVSASAAGGAGGDVGPGGADGGDRGAGVPAVRAADGGRVHLPVPPEGLQPPAEAGGGGHLLRPPLPGQGQDAAGPHLRHVHLWLRFRWVHGIKMWQRPELAW